MMLGFLIWLSGCMHPVHISVTEITYNEKNKSLEIVSRIFIDELELGVRAQRRQPELDLLEPPQGLTTKDLVRTYYQNHFKVKIDGKPVNANYIAYEKEDISIISYIEIANVKKIKTLEVFNDIVTEIRDDQSNLVHVTYKSPVKSVRLTRDNTLGVFTFDLRK
ncbi:MAG: hypothetical protein JST43_11255 [Bacteroidetes bacterium]|nr:hypothetical protein [Bacteroidota bacterium]MBS1540039.1 hypothetical protein [Bacteroidota bacterium]